VFQNLVFDYTENIFVADGDEILLLYPYLGDLLFATVVLSFYQLLHLVGGGINFAGSSKIE